MSDQLIQQMIKLYQSGLSLKEVGEIVGVSWATVRRRLEKNGISRRDNRKYFCNDDYFEIINTEPKSNWLGFLAADGNLSKRSPQIRLKLARTDKDHVVKFKEALNATNPIHDYEQEQESGKITYNSLLAINSKKMHADLISHGVPPTKSLILEPPIGVPDYLIPPWIRGCFDGDGHIGIHINSNGYWKKKVVITGTVEVLEFIRGQLGGMGHIHPVSESKAFSLIIGVQEDVQKFADYIYKDATVWMERKRATFKLGLSI